MVLTVVIPLLYCTVFLDKQAAEWLIEEEHPIELLGAFGLLAAGIACFVLWNGLRGDPAQPTMLKVTLFALGVLFIFGFGEEESWGQRILGITTPQSIAEFNEQNELNVHNLALFSGINSDTVFSVLWLVLGVIVPVLALAPGLRARLERFVPVLPVAMSGLFVVNQLLIWASGAFVARYPHTYHSGFSVIYSLVEIKETVAEVLVGVGLTLLLLQSRHRRAANRPAV